MATNPSAGARMPVSVALEVLAELRSEDQLVITNQGSAREWPRLCKHPLDFHYIPSAMGGAIPLALGLALAHPRRHVMVFSGDGSLLMNLGCLITTAASGAKNLTIVLVDNGVYEVTGGQRTAASGLAVDFAGIARSAGFPAVTQASELDGWRDQAAEFLAADGPRFAWLMVEPVRDDYLLDPPCPITQQLDRFVARLQ